MSELKSLNLLSSPPKKSFPSTFEPKYHMPERKYKNYSHFNPNYTVMAPAPKKTIRQLNPHLHMRSLDLLSEELPKKIEPKTTPRNPILESNDKTPIIGKKKVLKNPHSSSCIGQILDPAYAKKDLKPLIEIGMFPTSKRRCVQTTPAAKDVIAYANGPKYRPEVVFYIGKLKY